MRGEFVDLPEGGEQWCDAEVLRILRRRSLAELRAQVEPVSTAAYARFLPAWQQIGSSAGTGVDGLAAVMDQLAGVPCAGVGGRATGVRDAGGRLPARDARRAAGLRRGHLVGAGSISGSDGWIAFHHADTAPLTLAPPAEIEFTDTHRAILDVLGHPGDARGAFFSASWPTAPRVP